jgi:hypothetical protein
VCSCRDDFMFRNRSVNGINLVIDGGWLLT